MYRYTLDDAVTYSPDDFVLFRESPFALWMERLTLENPTHGIRPDDNQSAPQESAQPQGAIVETLRLEGRDVALIDWNLGEPERRSRTLDAMRDGADFIVDGQLALGDMSGAANLLMRTSGCSQLGDFLYIPCDTQEKTTLNSAFRLCFLADLLQSLQGQLPPQMLVIRGDADVVPLQTEDHICYYEAVKERFMAAMHNFRQHQVPDPSESAHFGRWSASAIDVMKRRVGDDEAAANRAGTLAGDAHESERDVLELEAAQEAELVSQVRLSASGGAAAQTLAEQARMLNPGTYRVETVPGRAPNLAQFPLQTAGSSGSVALTARASQEPPEPKAPLMELTEPGSAVDAPQEAAVTSRDIEASESAKTLEYEEIAVQLDEDAALRNLTFIGSGSLSSSYELESRIEVSDWGVPVSQAESNFELADDSPKKINEPVNVGLPELEPPEPFLLPPEDVVVAVSAQQPGKPHPLDSVPVSSIADEPEFNLDGVPSPALTPLSSQPLTQPSPSLSSSTHSAPILEDGDSNFLNSESSTRPIDTELSLAGVDTDEIVPPKRAFSDSLITNSEFDKG